MEPNKGRDLFIMMVLSAWNTQNSNLDQLLDSLTDEQLAKEISPGRNTGIYLLGHLTAISDAMLPLLGFGEKLYPELENVFINNPDKAGLEKPSIPQLKKCLKAVNEKLTDRIKNTPAAEWFDRHNSISAEDFAKEPHRNKLNVLINRSNHMANHLGQMVLLK